MTSAIWPIDQPVTREEFYRSRNQRRQGLSTNYAHHI